MSERVGRRTILPFLMFWAYRALFTMVAIRKVDVTRIVRICHFHAKPLTLQGF